MLKCSISHILVPISSHAVFNWNKNNKKLSVIYQFQSAVLVNAFVVSMDWLALALILYTITLDDAIYSISLNTIVLSITGLHGTAMVFVFDNLKGLALAGKKDPSAIKLKKTSKTSKNSKTVKKSAKSLKAGPSSRAAGPSSRGGEATSG